MTKPVGSARRGWTDGARTTPFEAFGPGVVAIRPSNGADGLEVDHVQFGTAATPVPVFAPLGSLELAAVLLVAALERAGRA